MVNLVFGSYSARGKKKRRNIRRLTERVPSTAAITKRRRRATTLTSSASSCLEKMVRIAWNKDGFGAAPFGAVPGGSTVVLAIFLSLHPTEPGYTANLRLGPTANSIENRACPVRAWPF